MGLVVAETLVSTARFAEPAEHETVARVGRNPRVLLALIPLAVPGIGPGEELLFGELVSWGAAKPPGFW